MSSQLFLLAFLCLSESPAAALEPLFAPPPDTIALQYSIQVFHMRNQRRWLHLRDNEHRADLTPEEYIDQARFRKGVSFPDYRAEGYFRSVALHFEKKPYKNVYLMLRIIALDEEGKPGPDLLTEALYFPRKKGWAEIDVSKLRIATPPHGFMVAVEEAGPVPLPFAEVLDHGQLAKEDIRLSYGFTYERNFTVWLLFRTREGTRRWLALEPVTHPSYNTSFNLPPCFRIVVDKP